MTTVASHTNPGGEAAGGLVPSINNVKTLCFPPEPGEFPTSIEVDKLKARCTRLRKNVGIAAKHLSQGGGQPWMLTFTYRDDAPWQASHVRDALRHLRLWMWREHRQRLRYLWVIESKPRKSGEHIGEHRPHYHCVIWTPYAVTRDDLKLDARGWWPHGMTNAVKAVAAVRYVMKYVSKFDHSDCFPKGARCYGIGGMGDVGNRIRRWINWPSFVQARASVADAWRRAPGGGWLDRSTGELWPSEWGLSWITRQSTRLVRLHHHPREWQPAGPFNWIGAAA